MKTKYIIISLSLIAFMGFWMIGGTLMNSGIHPIGILGIPLFVIQSFQDQGTTKQFEVIDDFDATYGGPGNRHPAFLGYDIPEICSSEIVKHLVRYSSMFDNEVQYGIEVTFGIDVTNLPIEVDTDDFDQCVKILLENRDEEPFDPKLGMPDEDPPDTLEIFSHGSTKYVNPNHESLKYYKTTQVIDDTYLGKNVQQWQDAWDWELEYNYEIYKDEFYEELGRLLVKNEITQVMNQFRIINAHDDFKVHQGYSLLSLPPHVGFTTVINATDGNSYLIEASAHSNRVQYYSITQLTFFDTTKELSLIDILSYPQTIHILPEDDNKSKAEPTDLIIHVDNSTVIFVNHTPKTIRIQESGTGEILKEYELSWIGPTIPPFGHDQVIFEKPGIYEWDARIAPTLERLLWWGSHAGGDVVVISDNMDDLPLIDRLDMGRSIIQNSEVPYSGMGIGNADHALKISLRSGIYEMLPDAVQYYQDRVEQLIPFDIPIILENPYGEE